MRRQAYGWIGLGLGIALAAGGPAWTRPEEGKAGPKSAGSPRLNAYFPNGFEDAAWQRAAFDSVARSWSADSFPLPGRKAVVISTITRDGKVMETKVGTASGSEGWDKAAVDAVKKAAPFPPLPKSWIGTSLEVHWHFELSR